MNIDTVAADTPVGKSIIDRFILLKDGESLREPLFPAIPEEVEWKRVSGNEKHWRFEGMYCGIPFMNLEVNLVGHMLMLTSMPLVTVQSIAKEK